MKAKAYERPIWLTPGNNIVKTYVEVYALKTPDKLAAHAETVREMHARNVQELAARIDARDRTGKMAARALGVDHPLTRKMYRAEIEPAPDLEKLLRKFLSQVKEQQDENAKRARRRHLARWHREAKRVCADPDNDYHWYGDKNTYPWPGEECEMGLFVHKVRCLEHGLIALTDAQYNAQMAHANDVWRCPWCQRAALFAGEFFECHGCGAELDSDADPCPHCGYDHHVAYDDAQGAPKGKVNHED